MLAFESSVHSFVETPATAYDLPPWEIIRRESCVTRSQGQRVSLLNELEPPMQSRLGNSLPFAKQVDAYGQRSGSEAELHAAGRCGRRANRSACSTRTSTSTGRCLIDRH